MFFLIALPPNTPNYEQAVNVCLQTPRQRQQS